MSLCPYLTDSERHILPTQEQDQYRYYVVFNLRGVRYIRWFLTDMDRVMYLAWLHADLEVLSIGVEPTKINRLAEQKRLDSLGSASLRIWLEEYRP